METIKNLVYAGVGLASTATDKVKHSIEDLVEKGKISDTEGKRIIDDIFKTTENTKEEIDNKVKSITDKITSTFDFKGKKDTKVVDALEKKISDLEKQLAEAKKAAKPVAKKTTATTKKAPAKRTVAKKTTTKKTVTTK
jgi:polyhydroxyalkanoate synthesis regulator phasin